MSVISVGIEQVAIQAKLFSGVVKHVIENYP